MPSLPSRILSASLELNISSMRVVSALRRGAVVLFVLVAANAFLDLSIAVNAAMSTFLIGLADKGGSPRATWETMAVATVFLSCLSVILGYAAGIEWLIVLILMIMAMGIATSGVIFPRAPQIFVFGALYTASQLINTPAPEKIIPSALLIAFCGMLQTVTTLVASPVIADLPERRLAASALRAVANTCKELSAMGNELHDLSREAAHAFARAESAIKRCDIEVETREMFLALLNDADIIRIEVRGLYARSHLGIRYPNDPGTFGAFAIAGEILELAAAAITKRRSSNLIQQLKDRVDEIHREFDGHMISRTATSILNAVYAIPEHAEDLSEVHRVKRRLIHQSTPLKDRARVAFDPRQITMRLGMRLAAAALVSVLISTALHLPHASWVATTAIMVLRPDGGPTATRILLRALGTTAAVAAVILILYVEGSSLPAIFVTIGITSAIAYAVVSVNYGFYAAAVAATMVMIYSLTYPHPAQLAFARWIDVLLGCVIAAVFALVIPVWSHNTLVRQVADYIENISGWFRVLGEAAMLNPDDRQDAMVTARRTGSKSRDYRLMAVTTFRTALVEPASRKVDTGAIGVILAWMRRCSDAGVAAETMLRHGLVGGPSAKLLADQTAEDLAVTVENLRLEFAERDPSIPHDLRQSSAKSEAVIRHAADNRMTSILAMAETSAAAALRASYRLEKSHRPRAAEGSRG